MSGDAAIATRPARIGKTESFGVVRGEASGDGFMNTPRKAAIVASVAAGGFYLGAIHLFA
jgi:hypothetical protein